MKKAAYKHSLLGTCLGVELLGPNGNSKFYFLKNFQTLPQQLNHFTFPPVICEDASFTTTSCCGGLCIFSVCLFVFNYIHAYFLFCALFVQILLPIFLLDCSSFSS